MIEYEVTVIREGAEERISVLADSHEDAIDEALCIEGVEDVTAVFEA